MNFTWLQDHALVIAFYIGVALLIYFNRKKFEFQGIVAILKTKLGIKQMQTFATPLTKKKDELGKKIFTISTILLTISIITLLINTFFNITNNYAILLIISATIIISFFTLCVALIFFRQIKPVGTLGIYIGFIGMAAMLSLMFAGLYQLIFIPTAPPMFAPVLPGISIPGSPFTLPLFEGLIALLIVVAIHEFAHGVVSKAYKIPIKSSGFVMFGPLPGAFVEPDEKKLNKAPAKTQLSIYAAGPMSNMLLAGFIFILMIGIGFITVGLYEPAGVKIDGIIQGQNDTVQRGINQLEKGTIITKINDEEIKTSYDLIVQLQNYEPQDQLSFQTNNGQKNITLGQDPQNESKPYMGIYLDNAIEGKTNLAKNKTFQTIYLWLMGNPYSNNLNNNLGVISLIFVLSFGIGLVNLLPAGPLDGGRMFMIALKQKYPEKKSTKILNIITNTIFLLIIILIFVPIIQAIFF
ncbi:MAG: site-2 protease family protein [Candidatus Woesearchaeota archaeon]